MEIDIDSTLDSLLRDGRAALAALDTSDWSVAGLLDRVGALRYAEGTLVGFLKVIVLVDPNHATVVAPKVEAFIGEAIAARLLLD